MPREASCDLSRNPMALMAFSQTGGRHFHFREKAMAVKDKIEEHMEVLGSDGKHVGTVDDIEGVNQIKLTKTDPAAGGAHHFIPLDWVDHVDEKVHLTKTSSEAMQEWL
jgi:hypothetical protein